MKKTVKEKNRKDIEDFINGDYLSNIKYISFTKDTYEIIRSWNWGPDSIILSSKNMKLPEKIISFFGKGVSNKYYTVESFLKLLITNHEDSHIIILEHDSSDKITSGVIMKKDFLKDIKYADYCINKQSTPISINIWMLNKDNERSKFSLSRFSDLDEFYNLIKMLDPIHQFKFKEFLEDYENEREMLSAKNILTTEKKTKARINSLNKSSKNLDNKIAILKNVVQSLPEKDKENCKKCILNILEKNGGNWITEEILNEYKNL